MSNSHEHGQYHVYITGGNKTEVNSQGLKKRIQRHYNMSAEQFLKVWGEHIHHGFFSSPADTNEQAQINQVLKLVESSGVSAGSRVLDVGCGIGGTARYLAREKGCTVTAITNSWRQAQLARDLTSVEGTRMGSQSDSSLATLGSTQFVQLPSSPSTASTTTGAVRILDLDIEQMQQHLEGTLGEKFDCVWMSEVVFHLHVRQLCFDSAFALLDPGGCMVIADIFRATHDPASATKREQKELASILRNHLCPQLGSVEEYTQMARSSGFRLRHDPIDVTKNVARTWGVQLPLRSVLYLVTQGRDAIGYMRGMRSMKRAYAHGTAIYAILCFEKP